jgi:hypothetical protein
MRNYDLAVSQTSNQMTVIPAKAGIQCLQGVISDPRLREDDKRLGQTLVISTYYSCA